MKKLTSNLKKFCASAPAELESLAGVPTALRAGPVVIVGPVAVVGALVLPACGCAVLLLCWFGAAVVVLCWLVAAAVAVPVSAVASVSLSCPGRCGACLLCWLLLLCDFAGMAGSSCMALGGL